MFEDNIDGHITLFQLRSRPENVVEEGYTELCKRLARLHRGDHWEGELVAGPYRWPDRGSYIYIHPGS